MLKNLAEIAIEAELASAKALERAAAIADRDGIPLIEALVSFEKVDELALIGALRKQLRVPLADPASVMVESEALRSLSQDVCRRRRVMPLAVVYEAGEKRLRLAMADPTDPVAIAEVEHRSGLTIVPELMTLSAITEMVSREYKKIVTEVVKRDRRLFGDAAHDATRNATASRPTIGGAATSGAAAIDAARAKMSDSDNPKTIPFHRISDEAELAVRFNALLRLLIENKIISEDEFEDEVRDLLRELSES